MSSVTAPSACSIMTVAAGVEEESGSYKPASSFSEATWKADVAAAKQREAGGGSSSSAQR